MVGRDIWMVADALACASLSGKYRGGSREGAPPSRRRFCFLSHLSSSTPRSSRGGNLFCEDGEEKKNKLALGVHATKRGGAGEQVGCSHGRSLRDTCLRDASRGKRTSGGGEKNVLCEEPLTRHGFLFIFLPPPSRLLSPFSLPNGLVSRVK